MPTGYTEPVKSGKITELNDFIMRCARAMGACVMMREDPSDAIIPERFEPSDYHKERLEKLNKELEDVLRLSEEESTSMALEDYAEKEKNRINRLDETKCDDDRYRKILDKVFGWTPPTQDHQGLKDFMVEQLKSSMKFDDMGDYYSKRTEQLSGFRWKSDKVISLDKDIKYHKEKHTEEVERTERRNTWLKQLRESLKT